MATPKHGRRGRLYADGAILPLIATWKVNEPPDPSDSTAMGDDNKSSTQGIPDFELTFSGWMDEDSASVYAFRDNADHYTVIYADLTSPVGKRHYWKGYMNGAISTEGGTGGTIKVDGTLKGGGGGVTKGYA